jgi:hypothetical protein
MEEGHHGFARFGMFDTQLGIGQLGLAKVRFTLLILTARAAITA